MATGFVDVNFGAFPGAPFASVAVTGQTTFTAGTNAVEAWKHPSADTTEHTVMEQVLEQLEVSVGNMITGTGFTIYVQPLLGGNLHGNYKIAWAWV